SGLDDYQSIVGVDKRGGFEYVLIQSNNYRVNAFNVRYIQFSCSDPSFVVNASAFIERLVSE
ncbi:MAG: hypothetical protein AAFX99_33885, partial [Myxococcota bacterium]